MAYNYKNSYHISKLSGEEEDEEGGDVKFPFIDIDRKPYKQFDQTFTAQHVHFYISKEIGSPDGYVDMVHRMAIAAPSDVIFIHLNTPGGQIDTGVQVINAMQNSQAKIITILEGVAYSLGTLIFLAGDEMVVNDHCMMMFHNFSSGLSGKGNELASELQAKIDWFSALASDIYVPFLTEDEFKRIVKGEDMWMQTPEIKTRLENMVKTIQRNANAEKRAAERAEKTATAKDKKPQKHLPALEHPETSD